MLSRTALRAFARPSRSFTTSIARRAAEGKSAGNTVEKLEGVYDNAFNRERLAVKKHAAASADFWRKLSIYVVVPALIVVGANTWVQWTEHWEHQAHLPPLEERTQYSYMNIRTKAYPWSDGDKTAFWNSKYNFRPKEE